METPEAGNSGPVGFAGLATMVSNVDSALASARRHVETSGSQASGHPLPASADGAQKEVKASPKGESGSSSIGMTLVIVILLFVFGLLYFAANHTAPDTWSPPPRPSQTSTQPPQTASWAKQTTPAPPPAQSTYALPVEDRPPVGTDIVLNVAQIRYCLSESIRIDGARPAVDRYSNNVERFNSMIRDYNSRCSNFRYRSSTLETARSEVERRRSTLLEEGRRRFGR